MIWFKIDKKLCLITSEEFLRCVEQTDNWAAFANSGFRNQEYNFLPTGIFRANFKTRFTSECGVRKKRRSVCTQNQAAKPRIKTLVRSFIAGCKNSCVQMQLWSITIK